MTLAEIKEIAEVIRQKDAKKKALRKRMKALLDAQSKKASFNELRKLAGPVSLKAVIDLF